MKIKSRYFLKDRCGEAKIKRKFMWIPESFGEKFNRWLSFENVLYTIVSEGGDTRKVRFRWKAKKFATKEDMNLYKIEKSDINWGNVLFLSCILFFLTLYYFSNDISFVSITAAIIITRFVMGSPNFQDKGDTNV